MAKPVVIVVDDLATSYESLVRNIAQYDGGRLAQEFDYVLMISPRLARSLKQARTGKSVLAALTFRQVQESFLSLIETLRS